MNKFVKRAQKLGELVAQKNEAYGNSFAESEKILKVLYPDGVRPDQYTDILVMARVLDKLFRVANKKDAFEESPWQDISGYGLLMTVHDEEIKEEQMQLSIFYDGGNSDEGQNKT